MKAIFQNSRHSWAVALFAIFLFLITLLPKFGTWFFAAMLLLWIIDGGWKERLAILKVNKAYWIWPIFYLAHFVSVFYSEDTANALRKMETFLTLLLIPLIIPTFKAFQEKGVLKKLQWAYIAGIGLNMLICIIRSTILFFYELYCRKHGIELESYPYTNYFFYSYLSVFMHYGYMAMYVNVALIMLLQKLIRKELSGRLKKLGISLLILFSIFVLMLYSKAGIIALFAIFLYYIAYQIWATKNVRNALMALGAAAVLCLLLVFVVPNTQSRIQGMIDGVTNTNLDPKSHDSTQLRIHVWKSAWGLIQERWGYGFGVGDANQKLIKSYQANGYTAAFEEDLNAHNQFLQTSLNIGILGILILLLFFTINYRIGLNAQSFSLQAFVLIMMVAFLTESFLQTQKGVFLLASLSTLILFQAKAFQSEKKS